MDPARNGIGLMAGPITLSVIVPMRDEADNVDALFARLLDVLRHLDIGYEVICVDDGSRDDTAARVARHHETDPSIKLLSLSRDFGKEAAMTAGLDHAAGAAAVILDADLQHPPELIPAMVEAWRAGADVAYGARRAPAPGRAAIGAASTLFHGLFNRLAERPIPADASDFRLLDRKVIDALCGMREQARFMRGLFGWVGFSQVAVPYDIGERHGGRGTWSLVRLIGLAVTGLLSFSSAPLRLIVYLAGLSALGAVAWAVAAGTGAMGNGALLSLGVAQLVGLGIIALYVERIHNESKGRPIYLIRRRLGFDVDDGPPK